MGYGLMGLGGLFLLIGVICQIIVLIKAFQSSVVDGLLTFFIPIYGLYFAFAKMESPSKSKIIAGWLGGVIAGSVLMGAGASMMSADLQASFAAEMQKQQ